MTKELSIENIKKELIDKISNNEEVLEYFEEHYRENGANDILIRYGRKVIKDNFIFAHDMSVSNMDMFISVEVNEEEIYTLTTSGREVKTLYKVNIMVALENDNDLDKMAMLLGKIATELYPDRCDYKNSVYNIEHLYPYGKKQIVRVVQFRVDK